MDHAKKLEFIHRMTKLGLEHVKHYDSGGEVRTQGGGVLQGIGDFLGTQDKFQAGSADIKAGTNQDQLNKAYTGTQGALGNQENLANTVIPQASSAVAQQNNLANQLTDMTQGKGPNPAMARLNEATAANTANTAALMAGQRGAATNPGLIARQAAQTGAANQQAAVGQAATMQAEQQIAAQRELQNLSANQLSQTGQALSNENQFQQNEQGVLQNANTAANNAAVNMQSNVNNANAMTAAANQQSNMGLFGNLASSGGGGLAAIASMFGAEGGEIGVDINPKKYAAGGETGSSPSFVANFLNNSDHVSTGSLSGPGEIPMAPKSDAKLPEWDKIAAKFKSPSGDPATQGSAGYLPDGSYNDASALPTNSYNADAAGGGLGSLVEAGGELGAEGGQIKNGKIQHLDDGGMAGMISKLGPLIAMLAAQGGKVPALVSPGEVFLDPRKAEKVAEGKADPIKEGKKVPGKPKYPGNDYRNDIVPAKLKEGGVILPNEITEIKNQKVREKKAIEFVRATLAKKQGLRKKA